MPEEKEKKEGDQINLGTSATVQYLILTGLFAMIAIVWNGLGASINEAKTLALQANKEAAEDLEKLRGRLIQAKEKLAASTATAEKEREQMRELVSELRENTINKSRIQAFFERVEDIQKALVPRSEIENLEAVLRGKASKKVSKERYDNLAFQIKDTRDRKKLLESKFETLSLEFERDKTLMEDLLMHTKEVKDQDLQGQLKELAGRLNELALAMKAIGKIENARGAEVWAQLQQLQEQLSKDGKYTIPDKQYFPEP